MSNRCEDYPCCGHTDGLPCDWTYTPEAQSFDMMHSMCDHEMGHCEVGMAPEVCDFCGESEDDCECGNCDPRNGVCENEGDCRSCSEYWLDFHADGMEDQWLDGSYEE